MICIKPVFGKLKGVTPLEKPWQRSEKKLKKIFDKYNVGCEKLWNPQQGGTS